MATTTEPTRAAAIRRQLSFPIVDCDGHVLEVSPVFVEHIRETVGDAVADAYASSPVYRRFSEPWRTTQEERRRQWIAQPNMWGWPTRNTLDRATATIPALYASRMDDLGIDYSLLYPSEGLFIVHTDPSIRADVVRAYNAWVMELCRPHADRLCAVASIPMDTPEEAIAHLEHAVRDLGHKVVCMQGWAARPVPAAGAAAGSLAGFGTRVDWFGLDSEHDYDAVWAKCVELQVAPTFHSASPLRAGRSASNYTYNHIGSVAQAQEGLAKSLFLGGVTRRFPTLNFGFLECGASWACSLYADLVGHFAKRNLAAMRYVDPTELDVEALMGHFGTHGDGFTRRHLDLVRSYYTRDFPPLPERDDFAAVEIGSAEEIKALFVDRFFIGCEADDRSVAWAFNHKVNPFGARIRAMFGSDVGHWDVTDVGDVVVEAEELVDDGLISAEDFKDFMFTNPVMLHAGVNPGFFTGTRVERDVEALLAELPRP